MSGGDKTEVLWTVGQGGAIMAYEEGECWLAAGPTVFLEFFQCRRVVTYQKLAGPDRM